MPQYRNNSANPNFTLEGEYIPSGGYVNTKKFIQVDLPPGVVADNTIDLYDPVIGSSKINSTSTYTIPATTGAYEIEIFCLSGEVSLKYNSTNTAANACLLCAGMKTGRKVMSRLINDIAFTIATGVAYVVVTKA